MSVLDPAELAASPLADLHLLANELGVDGFRRLRKAELVNAILVAQGGEPVELPAEPARGGDDDADDAEERPRRSRARGRGRSRQAEEETVQATAAGDEAEATEGEEEDRPRRRSRSGRGGRGSRDGNASANGAGEDDGAAEQTAEGTVEIAPNGSGFVRLSPPESSDADVYISAAQIKRCELVAGDTVSGPVRPPRRSERYPSLVRVDTINGRPADEVAGEGTRFEDLASAFPAERFELGSEDPTVKAIEWLTPFGKGSRVVVCGAGQAGKTEALARIAGVLNGREGIEISLVLTGARPEEVTAWTDYGLAPAAAATLGASPEAQAQALDSVLDQAKRVVSRGGDAVVFVDALDEIAPGAARRALAAARNVVDGGSLTIVAASSLPLGGETTVIALDPALTAARRFPALDLLRSGTLRAELLVGDAGAEAIAKARGEAIR